MAISVIFNSENNVYSLTSSYYKSPTQTGDYAFQSLQDFAQDIPDGGLALMETAYGEIFSITDASGNNVITFKYEFRGGIATGRWYQITQIGTQSPIEEEQTAAGLPILNGTTYTVNLSSQTYIIKYGFDRSFSGSIGKAYVEYTGYLNAVYNRLPLKKWTITDVIVRACDLLEPLKYGQKPRFRLDGVNYDDTTGNATTYTAGSIAEKLDKIIAPEVAFTKMTFREQMQLVGGYIHGEFRITEITPKSVNDRRYFTFTFDEYGGNKKAVIKDLKKPISATFKTDINEYCTALDTSAENLTNQLDWAQGVMIEPFNGGAISLRSETTTARMEDDNNSFIPTSYPLYLTGGKTFKVYCNLTRNIPEQSGTAETLNTVTVSSKKVYYSYNALPFTPTKVDVTIQSTGNVYTYDSNHDENEYYFIDSTDHRPPLGSAVKYYIPASTSVIKYDITPYVFEKADYDLLSSYDGTYPYCKAYALYYTQGERNIKGLFFKNENAISSIFERYAIVNILRAVTGDNSLTFDYDGLMTLSFTIEYKPIYSERIRTNKACVISGLPRTLAYNQSANIIESRFFGEHLKGIVSRLGNVEKTLTYNLAWLSDIPKIGTLYDENYYISAVYTEILPTHIKCTIALSKDFNRLSQYIGINSEKRMWEVSEKMAQTRETVIPEYLMISKTQKPSDSSMLFGYGTTKIVDVFNKNAIGLVSAVEISTKKKDTGTIKENIALPVMSASSGNSMLFTFKFADNYSAGQKTKWFDTDENAIRPSGGNKVSGRYADYVPYCDYYGRFWWLGLVFRAGNVRYDTTISNPTTFPSAKLSGKIPISGVVKFRKDNREVPQITYQLIGVTDDEDIIIGSALMQNSQFVNREPVNMELWVFPKELNRINSIIDFTGATQVNLPAFSNVFVGENIDFTGVSVAGEYSAWAIVTHRSTKTIQVVDDDNNEITQEIASGGELILGGNGELPDKLYLSTHDNLYD